MGKSLGQVGYEAYAVRTGGKTFDGRAMPTWEEIGVNTPHIQRAWNTAASAIRIAVIAEDNEPTLPIDMSAELAL